MAKSNAGRPPIDFNYQVLDALLQYKSTTKKFAAEYIGCAETTIDTRLKDDHGMTFSEYHQHKMSRISNKLEEKAIKMALNGDRTMLIFCLKNYPKWSDKMDVDVTHQLANFADWAKKAADQYEKNKQRQTLMRTEARRAKLKDVKPK